MFIESSRGPGFAKRASTRCLDDLGCAGAFHPAEVAQDFAPVLELAHQLALDLGCLCRTTEHSLIESANFWGRVVWLR